MSERLDNYYEQGLAHLNDGAYEDAIDLLGKAIRLSLGDIAEIYLYRGEAYAYLERWEAALEDFNQALRREPYMAEAYNERGNLWRFQEKYEQALEDYGVAIRVDPDHYEAYYNRALAYEEMREWEKACTDLTQTIELNPGLAPAYEVRGRIRAEQHKYDEAIEDLNRYLRMGGGREYDNHSETLGMIFSLRLSRLVTRIFRRRGIKKND